ncbi:MAG: hypothetical protein ABI306_01730 [Caulobacteraceae bacterium]
MAKTPKRPPDLQPHRVMVAGVRASRRFDPAPGIQTRQVERVSGALRQPIEIEELGAPVAFAEGVDRVDITHDAPGGGEVRAFESAEKIRLFEPPVNVGHAGFDEPPELKLAAALGARFD